MYKKDEKRHEQKKRCKPKKKQDKGASPCTLPPPPQLRNHEAEHKYAGLKMNLYNGLDSGHGQYVSLKFPDPDLIFKIK